MDSGQRIVEAVKSARASGQRLVTRGLGSKRRWLAEASGEFLETLEHTGIVAYDPAELVVTARAGTPLRELAAELAQADQALAFEPPQFFASGTVGGMVSAGLSGPSRPWCGSTRDAVLGVEIVNGLGEQLTFGGQVMKNVAGYDVSRLMAGACGALGVVLQVSLRVQPEREHVATLRFELDAQQANDKCRRLAGSYLPLTGTWWTDGCLYLRLAGTEAGVLSAQRSLGGDRIDPGRMWEDIRDHSADFFKPDTRGVPDTKQQRLWRVIVPPAAPLPRLPVSDLAVEWGGGQRWLWHDAANEVNGYARAHQGWAHALGEGCVLDAIELRYMNAIKRAFDPDGVFASPLALDVADAH